MEYSKDFTKDQKSKWIKSWSEAYDDLKYPQKIYDELVKEGKSNPDKLSLMGAWKTGCIRINNDEAQPVYTDSNSNKYSFNGRWKPGTRVYFDTWNDISKDLKNIEARVPDQLPENKPDILQDLESREGFGNVWGLFVLHCIRPNIFPLYDQHVYRAFRYIESNGKDIPNQAPKSWDKYINYSKFFTNLAKESRIDTSTLDRALWSYGKHLKLRKSAKQRANNTNNITDAASFVLSDNEWCILYTLGGKKKRFWFKLEPDKSITIARRFNHKSGLTKSIYTISKSEINSIHSYLNNGNAPLANNVHKLANGTEKEGIGKFLYEQLDWKSTTKCQLASQLASIFFYAGIWGYNGNSRGMEFWKNHKNCLLYTSDAADDN